MTKTRIESEFTNSVRRSILKKRIESELQQWQFLMTIPTEVKLTKPKHMLSTRSFSFLADNFNPLIIFINGIFKFLI